MVAPEIPGQSPANATAQVQQPPLPLPRSQPRSAMQKLFTNLANARKRHMDPVILLTCGQFAPVHHGHIRMQHEAAEYLATNFNVAVVVAVLSPSHEQVCRSSPLVAPEVYNKLLTQRARLIDDATSEDVFVAGDYWELSQPGGCHPVEVAQHLQTTIAVRCKEKGEQLIPVWLCAGCDKAQNLGRPDMPRMVVVGRAGLEVQIQDPSMMAKLGVVFVPTAATTDIRCSGIMHRLVTGAEVQSQVWSATANFLLEMQKEIWTKQKTSARAKPRDEATGARQTAGNSKPHRAAEEGGSNGGSNGRHKRKTNRSRGKSNDTGKDKSQSPKPNKPLGGKARSGSTHSEHCDR